MANEKAGQRDQLLVEMGILIQPINECLNISPPSSPDEYSKAIAKTQAGVEQWSRTVSTFATFGEVRYNRQFDKIMRNINTFLNNLNSLVETPKLRADVNKLYDKASVEYAGYIDRAKAFVAEIPIEWESEIFPANTPFTSYLKIREVITTGETRFHYFDRYIKPELFRLYIKELPRNIEVRVVTTEIGVNAVHDISELVADEYIDFQLIKVHQSLMHDRNLRVDDNIFSLGPGIDQAGAYPSNFGPVDNSSTAQTELDQLIEGGMVISQSN